jgi:hypothetical protein
MDKVFSSWKEIAAYLGKGVRTVQRWEAELELPVHRPSEQGIVLAYESELQQWARQRAEGPPSKRANGSRERYKGLRERSSELCQTASERIRKLQSTLERTRALGENIRNISEGRRGEESTSSDTQAPRSKSVPSAA